MYSRYSLLIFIALLVCSCKNSTTKSDDEGSIDSAFLGSWQLMESSENGEEFDESITDFNIIFTFNNETIVIDWGGFQAFTGDFSTEENENPKELDIELNSGTPWHHNPVLCIYNFEDAYTLVIKINDGIDTRAQNFNIDTNYDIYTLSKFLN